MDTNERMPGFRDYGQHDGWRETDDPAAGWRWVVAFIDRELEFLLLFEQELVELGILAR